MYLPTQDERERADITAAFEQYKQLRDTVSAQYGATEHWAKLEQPRSESQRLAVHQALCRSYPISQFNEARKHLDPRGVLSNSWADCRVQTSHQRAAGSEIRDWGLPQSYQANSSA